MARKFNRFCTKALGKRTLTTFLILVVTFFSIGLLFSYHPFNPIFYLAQATPDVMTLRPNAVGTYQQWSVSSGTHYGATSDLSDTTYVYVIGSTSLKETENLEDSLLTGAISSVTAYMRAEESGTTSEPQQISFVGTTSGTENNPTSGSWSLPSSWQAGDVAIFWWYTYADTKTFTDPATVTQKYDVASTGYGRLFIGYRVLQTGDTTFSWTASSVSSSTTIYGTSVFRNVDSTGDPFEAVSGSPATFTNVNDPDSPAVTTLTDKAWVYPVFGKRNDYTSIVPPSGYITTGSGSSTSGSDASVGTAYYEKTPAGSADPGIWTLGGGLSTDDGYVWTGALKPANVNPVEQAVILWRTYSTDYESSATTISRTDWTNYSQVRTENPNSENVWTWNEINALQIGVRASQLGLGEDIRVSEFWVVVEYTVGFEVNLRVIDYDMTDDISGAYVNMDNGTEHVQISDINGWANWTSVSGTISVEVTYFGFVVNGTSINVDSDKTVDLRCNLYDVIFTAKETVQTALLQNANISIWNVTSGGSMITSGLTNIFGVVVLNNLPNNTLSVLVYGDSVLIESQTFGCTSDEQSVSVSCDDFTVTINFDNWQIPIVVTGVITVTTKRMEKKEVESNEKL
jgi:hypothetical protein